MICFGKRKKQMKKKNSNADERQQQELYKAAYLAFWVTIGVLLIVILLQMQFMNIAKSMPITGEAIAAMAGVLSFLIRSIVKGVWGFRSQPSQKTFVFCGLIVAIFAAVMYWLMNRNAINILSMIAFSLAFFIISYLILFISAIILKKRVRKYEKELE